MTDASIPTSFAPGDFRVGGVLNRTASLLLRHFLVFMVVSVVANLPLILLWSRADSLGHALRGDDADGYDILIFSVGAVGFFLLNNILSQAVIVHAAFQAMRARPISLGESLSVGLARFIPVLLLGLLTGILVVLASLPLILPGLVLITMWLVGTPACVVERLGPRSSLKRSAELTKGHGWKVFGLLALIYTVGYFVSAVIGLAIAPFGNVVLTVLDLISNALWSAYYAIAVVVAYHDLRVAKEGIDIEQITTVFD